MSKTILRLFCLTSLAKLCLANSTCSIANLTNLNFNCSQNQLANCMSVGSIALRCSGSPSFVMTLSQGNSGSYQQRTLVNHLNNSQIVNYNIYTAANKLNVFGDGSQGSMTINGSCDNCSINFYGFISSSLPATIYEGNYSDNLVLILNY